MTTCKTCKWWAKEPLNTGTAKPPERLCLRSKFMDFGAYGQDGRAIITSESFGCCHYESDKK